MGQIENVHEESIPDFDPSNPLCPGVKRPNGQVSNRSSHTRVVYLRIGRPVG